jgi:hypothetical protein
MKDTDQLKTRINKLIAQYDNRTKTGIRRRNEMADTINSGNRPKGYRYEFLVDSAYRIIDELGEIAKEFNDAHIDDMCTNFDFIDTLTTAIEMIKKASR